jgi:uncharacterized protein (TIGR03084 family)
VHEVLDALRRQHGALEAIIEPLDDAAWARATRCDGWDVADVVLHLAQTDELARASAEGRFAERLQVLARGTEGQGNVDDGAAAIVDQERGVPHREVLDRWRVGSAMLRVALAAGDPHRRVQWVSGQLSIHTLTTTRLAEAWIHTGDVADALGVAHEPTDDLEHIARLAWRTLPYAFSRDGWELHGPVAFDLRAPSGARWQFVSDAEPATVVVGSGAELCSVAARRVAPQSTSLHATGPDARAVLDLVRTYA